MKIKLMLAMLACAAAVMAAPVLVQVETTKPRPWNNLRLNMDASYTWGNNTTQSYAGIDIRGNFRVTNEVGALESVDVIFDAPIDDAYYARFNGGWSNISWLLDLGDATNALNTRVGVLETSTNALNTRMGAYEFGSGTVYRKKVMFMKTE